MRNDIAKMMKSASATVAARIGATQAEILKIMRDEWDAGNTAQRAEIVRYLQKETAIVVH